jgi:hypothetical protein
MMTEIMLEAYQLNAAQAEKLLMTSLHMQFRFSAEERQGLD